jgi:hypothetical protein
MKIALFIIALMKIKISKTKKIIKMKILVKLNFKKKKKMTKPSLKPILIL